MLRLKANEKEEVNKNRIWHSQRAILDSICTYCKVYEHEPLKYSIGQEKVKPQGSHRPVAVSHPKTIGGQCGQLGHFCLDKQPVPKIPTAPRSLIFPQKSSVDPKNLAKVVHKHHFTLATASKSLPTRFIALAHAMSCWPKWVTIQYWCKMMQ